MKFKQRKNQKGMATIEAIPLLIIFIMLVGYGLGLWGYVHSGILYSISARTYAFETFRHRTHLVIFREQGSALGPGADILQHEAAELRYHAIQDPSRTALVTSGGVQFVASERPISFGRPVPKLKVKEEVHRSTVYEIKPRNQTTDVSPAWLMIGYGICINASCGGS